MLVLSCVFILIGIPLIVFGVAFYKLDRAVDFMIATFTLLGIFFVGVGLSGINNYYRSEHLEGYMKVIDHHKGSKGHRTITVYANGVTMKCSVDSQKYNAAKDGKQEMFYVKYLRNEDNYSCESVK